MKRRNEKKHEKIAIVVWSTVNMLCPYIFRYAKRGKSSRWDSELK